MSYGNEQIDGFFRAAHAGKKIPVGVPGKIAVCSINTAQGTFLARSSSKRARALAAVMACCDAHEAAARS